jgi:hypothetical protein
MYSASNCVDRHVMKFLYLQNPKIRCRRTEWAIQANGRSNGTRWHFQPSKALPRGWGAKYLRSFDV